MIMKRVLLISFICCISRIVSAQQVPLYTQYMLNDFVFNPAITGTSDYYQAKSDNRYQWVGITDAPRTYILSVYGPHRTKDMGFGGYVFNDVTGPTSRTGAYGAYAYNVRLKEDLRLSMGLSVGLLQFKIDGSKVILHDEGDPSFGHEMYIDYVPDANMGLYLYASNYYFGFSASQLINNKIGFNELQSLGINKLKSHFMVHGGYTYAINDDFDLSPSLMVKYVSPAPVQFDLGLKCVYQKTVWAGFSYRTKDAFSFLLGYNHEEQLFFGYSYDVTFTNIKKYSSGTHELLIGARFNKIRLSKSRSKI
ncbi:MAG: hypothetical protein CVU05_07835 [Bacteroidetes bacterium HGW-Bacteroidetes-21]|nr:MAG: hypothetical protein CVU05_07835 [Bacteroidetes bacterium HGW-Bacteroidetes-21]